VQRELHDARVSRIGDLGEIRVAYVCIGVAEFHVVKYVEGVGSHFHIQFFAHPEYLRKRNVGIEGAGPAQRVASEGPVGELIQQGGRVNQSLL
jgi:hypothetical protein